jgi:hypothetical protein
MRTLLTTLLLSLAACSGQDLITLSEMTFDVSAVHHPDPDPAKASIIIQPSLANEGTGLIIQNSEDYRITLHEAAISWKSITMISAGEDPDCESGFDTTIDLHATENLLGEDFLTTALGSATIEDRAYCQFEVTLAPHHRSESTTLIVQRHAGEEHGSQEEAEAHEEAIGEEHDEEEHAHEDADEEEAKAIGNLSESHQEKTVYLRGIYSHEGQEVAFEISSDDAVVIRGTFQVMEGDETVDHALHRHEGEDGISILFGIKYDLLFRGINFELDSEEDRESKVLDNLNHAVHQYLGQHHG